MSTRTANDDLEAAAPESLCYHGVGASAVHDYAVGNGVPPAGGSENVTHATQVAFALLANITDEQKWQCMRNMRVAENACDSQHRCDAGAIIRHTRAIKAAALLADIQRGRCREHRVDMRAERHETASISGTNTEDIANFINLYVDETEFTK